jgi:hypothetical protein
MKTTNYQLLHVHYAIPHASAAYMALKKYWKAMDEKYR